MKKLVPVLMLALAPTILSASVPLRWTVETSRAVPATFEEYAGASYELEATLTSYGEPLPIEGDAYLFWQTNGMASAYWQVPATVTNNVLKATWLPEMDCGAKSYNCFIGVPGSVYNAAFQLRLRPTPGAVPSVLPLPVPTLDFQQVEVLHAPYYSKAETDAALAEKQDTLIAGSNITIVDNVISSTGGSGGTSDYNDLTNKPSIDGTSLIGSKSLADIGIDWNQTFPAGTYGAVVELERYPLSTNGVGNFFGTFFDSSDFTQLAGRAFYYLFVSNASSGAVDQTEHYALIYKLRAGGNASVLSDWSLVASSDRHTAPIYDPNDPNTWRSIYSFPSGFGFDNTSPYLFLFSKNPSSIAAGNSFARRCASGITGLTHGIVTNYSQRDNSVTYRDDVAIQLGFGDFITHRYPAATVNGVYADSSNNVNLHASDLNAYSRAEVDTLLEDLEPPTLETLGAASADDLASLNVMAEQLYSFVMGSTNAHFSVTNYLVNASEDATRTHYAPVAGMDFERVPSSLQLYEFRDGATKAIYDSRDWVVWYYQFKETALTNRIAQLEADLASAEATIESLKPWGNWTASGLESPFEDTLIVDKSNLQLMAGYEWEKHVSGNQTCFVLTGNGVANVSTNETGYLEMTDAFGDAYVRFNKTSSYFASAEASSISFNNTTHTWDITFTSTAHPIGAATATLSSPLVSEDDAACPATITWTGSAGAWVMHALPKTTPAPQMFFAARVEVQGHDYIQNLKPVSFDDGIQVGNVRIRPVVTGTTVTWEVISE